MKERVPLLSVLSIEVVGVLVSEVKGFQNWRGGHGSGEDLGEGSMLEDGLLSSSLKETQPLLRCSDLGRRNGFDGGVERTVEPGDVGVLEPGEHEKEEGEGEGKV